MPNNPAFVKIHDGIAGEGEFFQLLNMPPEGSAEDLRSGKAHAGRWFEITHDIHEEMFDRLPLRLMRHDMFAPSELVAGTVGSVYFEIVVHDRKRWFHGYCDLSDRNSPDTMRAAILAHESALPDTMTRAEKLEAIWKGTHSDYRGIAGEADPDAWPPADRGKRAILVYEPGVGTVIKLLECLSDKEIAERLPLCRT
ncbi:DUF1419 domain-containing protein [Sandaracinobacter sp. RS1-74]|uniref:DUF1419 domain-containing protein n=1 Tax=Sandaracinobacteroides sayramensis TaxID=2913411 RepID=UPI001EDB3BDD|nr:DUF1419 domain-containing protein [Sandaracinobacteroides sayramensis]MCG2841257.1 DUF1419 domain-containing protein [Sandaracinobacteroides sayramensis]